MAYGMVNLRSLRSKRGYSREFLARRAGLSVYAVAQIETGRRCGTIQTAQRIAAALDVGLDALCERPEKPAA